MGPWLKEEGEQGRASRVPAREVASGEGQGARENKGVKAHLLVCLGARKDGRRGGATAAKGGKWRWSAAMVLQQGCSGAEGRMSFSGSRRS